MRSFSGQRPIAMIKMEIEVIPDLTDAIKEGSKKWIKSTISSTNTGAMAKY
jgi:hypothetical protein